MDIRKQGRRAQKRQDAAQGLTLTKQFKPRFWEDADSRVSVVRQIRRRYELLKSHCGGEESIQRDLLCQRATFLSVHIETLEVEAAEGSGLDVGSYVQSLNCLNGLLKTLGLDKRVKNVTDLKTYLEEKGAA